jgi:hypothetical protein
MDKPGEQPGEQPGATPYPRTTDMTMMARRCFPETLAFYRYWDSKRASATGAPRRMPMRRDIEPLEMKRWLPCLQLLDVLPDTSLPLAQRLVYRLVGEQEIAVRGYNPTGRHVADAAIGPESSDPTGNYRIVVEEGLPVYDWSKIPHPKGFLVSQECILLPLSEDDQVVSHVITYGKVLSILEQAPRPR